MPLNKETGTKPEKDIQHFSVTGYIWWRRPGQCQQMVMATWRYHQLEAKMGIGCLVNSSIYTTRFIDSLSVTILVTGERKQNKEIWEEPCP